MKNKTKEIHNSIMNIGAAMLALAVAAGASTPAITSFTQAQPVTKTKKKAKAKTTVLKAVTLTKGKSRTVSVKTKSKVKWTSSNAKVASVKSISKSKVKVTAKKEGSTKVSGKAGSAKWSFSVKVKKANPKPTGTSTKEKTNKTNTSKKKTNASQKKVNVRISGIENNETIEFDEPGEANAYVGITVYTDTPNSIKFSSSDTSIIKTDVNYYKGDPGFSPAYASCDLKPQKTGKVTITISYPGGSKSYTVNVSGSKPYCAVEGFLNKINASNLDDAHKAFVTDKWLEKRISYGKADTSDYNGTSPDYLISTLIKGKGVCYDYAKTYEWMLGFENIKSRYISTGDIGNHGWNQICVSGKWYNVDVSNNDEEPFNPEGAECFMKSDNCSNDFFSDRRHAVKYRSGDGEYPVTATATDYDNFDWSSFAQSEQFKSLIS
ncbi:hypothetical protein SG0102_25120 [Intestinibaculum porci]|uniref:Transglutaminase-like domain-containing protein n=1 Tax=Intestinibaculum porci TaxID=2487118 RepID=A0A3G9JSW2_9FIRM|nr:transglutaminase domain-containing protein [Intestinibaculum porci]BBH27578.1 hypothetical protein SG0102_25120 [Intestinibaculum porci]